MSWSKQLKGSFADIRNALAELAGQVHDDDVKAGSSNVVREAHHLQARVAVKAAEELTAHAPFHAQADDEEDRDLEVSLYGHGDETGSGNVGVEYKIGPQKLKATEAK